MTHFARFAAVALALLVLPVMPDFARLVTGNLSPGQVLAVEVLARNGTFDAAAEAASINLSTLYRWRQEPEFMTALALATEQEAKRIEAEEEADAKVRRELALNSLEAANQLAKADPEGRGYAKLVTSKIVPKNVEVFDKMLDRAGRSRRVARRMPTGDGPTTVVNATANAAAQAAAVAQANAVAMAIPVELRSVREFVERDIGPEALPLSKCWPRVEWIVEKADDPAVRTVILEVGKGSGKSMAAALIGARMLQRVLAMPDPHGTLDLPPAVKIGVLNLSVTGNQAQMAIFAEMSSLISNSPWFKAHAKPEAIAGKLSFPKNIFALSGNSQSTNVEGLTWICALADELDRLPEDPVAKTSQARDLVEPVEGTLLTRFPRAGKLVIMSWPERQGSYIQERVAAARASGIARDLTAELRAVPIFRDKPDLEAERRATMARAPFQEYPEEAFLSVDGTLVVRGPNWAFSPRVDLALLAKEFTEKPFQAARMYGAKPLRVGEHPFFRDLDEFKRRATSATRHPLDEEGRWKPDVKGDPATYYYAHVDVGLRRDAAGIAVGHYREGRCIYDLLLEVRPQDQADGRVRMKALFRVLADMAARGFTFSTVSIDGFQGLAGQEDLQDLGFEAEVFSVDKDRRAYDTWLEAYHAGNLDYYESEPLFACVESLVDLGKKIDHTASGKKDLSDAAAAVAFHVFGSVIS